MMEVIQRFARNATGRDFAVGDIHGCFTRLRAALDAAGFDEGSGDRLFSVGDLVDRGPECESALEWLALPWFHAVRGNHEDIAIRYARGNSIDQAIYSRNGGAWFMGMDHARQKEFAAAFDALPYAAEVETEGGTIGLIHANVPAGNWSMLAAALHSSRRARDMAMWDRSRIEHQDMSGVAGIKAVVVGHTPVKNAVCLGNVFHIDTGGWLAEGHFTLLCLSTVGVA